MVCGSNKPFKDFDLATKINDYCANRDDAPSPVADNSLKPVSYGNASVLPVGVTRNAQALTDNDYMIADPMDQAAVDAIIYQTVCETRAQMEAGSKLFVVMGENHAMPVHVMAQAGLLENVALAAGKPGQPDHGKLIFAYEHPYNALVRYVSDFYDIFTDDVQDSLADYDPNGYYYLRAMLGDNHYPRAPQSGNQLRQTCLRYDIPLVPVDAGRNLVTDHYGQNKNIFSSSDPLLKELYPDVDFLTSEICVSDAEGVAIRNVAMVRRILNAAIRTCAADTVVLSTGLSHVAGDRWQRMSYADSLCVEFNKQIGAPHKILPVIFDMDGNDTAWDIEEQMWQDHPDALIIRGASDKIYDETNSLYPNGEKRFLKELGESYRDSIPKRFESFTVPDKDVVCCELKEFAERIKRDLQMTHTMPEPYSRPEL